MKRLLQPIGVCVLLLALVGIVVLTSTGHGQPNGRDATEKKGAAQKLLEERNEALHLVSRLETEVEKARQLIVELQGGIPAGTVVSYAGPCERPKDIPTGWVVCDGAVFDGADPKYERLYRSLGPVWGRTEGVPATVKKPFRIPDLRGRFLRGHSGDSGIDPEANDRTDLTGKVVAGNKVGTYQGDQVGPHTHDLDQKPHSHSIDVYDGDGGDPPNQTVADGDPKTRIDGHPRTSGELIDIKVKLNGTKETRPKNAAVIFLIKL